MKRSERKAMRARHCGWMFWVVFTAALGLLAWALAVDVQSRAAGTVLGAFFLLAVFLATAFAGDYFKLRRQAATERLWERVHEVQERGRRRRAAAAVSSLSTLNSQLSTSSQGGAR